MLITSSFLTFSVIILQFTVSAVSNCTFVHNQIKEHEVPISRSRKMDCNIP